jgi:hypothetical protein
MREENHSTTLLTKMADLRQTIASEIDFRIKWNSTPDLSDLRKNVTTRAEDEERAFEKRSIQAEALDLKSRIWLGIERYAIDYL